MAETDSDDEKKKGFAYPLPFDPLRLVAGVLTRWPLIVLGTIVFGVLGAFTGKLLTHPRYTLSMSLIKVRVPQNVQTSDVGQPFRPAELNDATLLATLLASAPRDAAFKRADNGVSMEAAASMTEASQLKNTDIFYITYHSPVGPDDAVRVCGIWAEEISEYTKRLQQAEALSLLGILDKEVAALEKKIEAANRELLDFAKSEDFIGGEAQITGLMSKLGQSELAYEEAKARQDSLRAQLEELKLKIRNHSPLNLLLRAAKDQLSELRGIYTDANPLVQSKLENIAYLESQIANLDQDAEVNLEAYTGTPLGNQLYLDIMNVKSRLAEASSQVESFQVQRETTAKRLSQLPSLMTRYNSMLASRDSYMGELSLLSKRLKEAEIFASGSPGYWQVFQPADARNIKKSSMVKKPAILGIAGSVMGAGLAILWNLFHSQRSLRRSVLECCQAARAPLAANLHRSDELTEENYFRLWMATLSPMITRHSGQILLWTAGLSAEEEREFWTHLAASSARDTKISLTIVDLSPDDLWLKREMPPYLRWQNEIGQHGSFCLLRASKLPERSKRSELKSLVAWYAVLRGEEASIRATRLNHHLTEVYFSQCKGTIVLSDPPEGKIRGWADRLSIIVTQTLS
ncbi:MAG: hypothetical protein EAZ81_03340 [Verrucomicrobia bacterium]|jgi:uncharacterized protein involved in exopolysaccharide biosynthesis|nr:MAG: hypothetical protein EAZ81_03340 [Verrucomicrobiota bacterium]